MTSLFLAIFKSLIPIKPRRHVQKVLNRDGFLSVVDIRDREIGEKIQRWMVETVKQAVLVNHSDPSADDRPWCLNENHAEYPAHRAHNKRRGQFARDA
jgi:hypothetical protein